MYVFRLMIILLAFLIVACAIEEEPIDRSEWDIENVENPPPAVVLTYCGNCHQTPLPQDITREIWLTEVLPKMGAFYGIYEGSRRQTYLESRSAAPYLEHLYPLERQLDSSSWAAIVDYYVRYAPDRLEGSKSALPLHTLKQFDIHPVASDSQHFVAPFTTVLHFDAATQSIYTGGTGKDGSALQLFSASSQRWTKAISLYSTPSAIDVDLGLVLEMGSLLPSDLPRGKLTTLGEDRRVLLDSLARPVDMLRLDLNQDGVEEIIIAEFGNMVGYLNAYTPKQDGTYQFAYRLATLPGALRLRKADMDQDGHDDLVVLFAQGNESIQAFYSRPGSFEQKQLAQFPPSFGSSDLEIIDFDGDGQLDVLYTNGDNFDYQPIPKPYHGIRLLLNDGQQNFKTSWFYPMDGAYDLEVADFDQDGDLDIAAIAYFVPPMDRSAYSFVYLEQINQKGSGKKPVFKAFSFAKPKDQFYLRLLKADVDQDGDEDLIIGNFSAYLPDGARQAPTDMQNTPVYIWLENKK